MKISPSCILLLLTITSFSCKQEKKALGDEVTVMWTSFLSDLEAEDKEAFKNTSAATIRCYDCLENTPSEVQKMNLLRDTDSLWYHKIYDDLINIPIDQFIENDFDILFNPQFVKILRDNDISFLEDKENEVTTVHILVTTTPPTAEFEGAQHSFSFTKTIDGVWKLNEISTIP
jgi:hypothetical protein